MPRIFRDAPAPSESVLESVSDVLLTECAFRAMSRCIFKTLWKKGDDTARLGMVPGDAGPSHEMRRNVRAVMDRYAAAGVSVRAARGWKMFGMVVGGRIIGWRAAFHIVVEHLDPAQREKRIYECATPHPWGGKEPFIFLPSSRAHAEVSDGALLNDDDRLQFGVVFGCNPEASVLKASTIYVNRVLEIAKKHLPAGKLPEEVVSRDLHPCCIPPLFEEWCAERHPDMNVHTVAMLMGFPKLSPCSSNKSMLLSWLANADEGEEEQGDHGFVKASDVITQSQMLQIMVNEKKISNEKATELMFAIFDKREACRYEINPEVCCTVGPIAQPAVGGVGLV